MKKISFFAMTAIAVVFGFSACQSEVDMFETNGTGSIALNVTNDDNTVVAARATVSATAEDWYVVVNNDAAITVKALSGKAYAAQESNTLKVYNYLDDAAALAANGGRGAARWEGTSESFKIEAGKTTNVSVACGVAKNAAFGVAFNESFTGVAADGYKVAVSQNTRSLDFTASNEAEAYYSVGEVTYSLTATVNGKNVNVSKNVTLAAGTKTLLTVKANTNGTISLTITYDELTDADAQEVTIDAATGNEVVLP